MVWFFVVGCLEYELDKRVSNDVGEDSGLIIIDDTSVNSEPSPEPDEEIAKAPVYANTSGSLYEVDPTTGEVYYINDFFEGTEAVDHFEDIAIDLSGHMYGGTGESLYLINPTTAEVHKICDLTLRTTALTFTDDGRLVVGTENQILFLDVINCETEVLIANAFHETSGDIVGLPDGYLYWTVFGEGTDFLVQIDPNTGHETEIGPIGFSQLFGLGYSDGQLYGFNSEGKVLRMSPHEGQAIISSQREDLSWWGAATNPVSWGQ
jgi:large repetitive protein